MLRSVESTAYPVTRKGDSVVRRGGEENGCLKFRVLRVFRGGDARMMLTTKYSKYTQWRLPEICTGGKWRG